MKRFVSLLALLGLASIALADEHAAESLDYGDYASVTLTTKAWDALGEGRYADAVKYTEKCAEMYTDEARQMQLTLSAKAPKERAHDYWALNDVGTGYFIRGEALMKLKKDDEALAAYKTLVSDFSYAQAWDPKGWFWAPADAAAQKIELIEARQKDDF